MSHPHHHPDKAHSSYEAQITSISSAFSGISIAPYSHSSVDQEDATRAEKTASTGRPGRTYLDMFYNLIDCRVRIVPSTQLQRGSFIGRGHTMTVYQGTLLDHSTPVALKYTNIDASHPPTDSKETLNGMLVKEASMEIRVMTHPDLRRHRNVADIYGVSLEKIERGIRIQDLIDDADPATIPLLQPIIIMELAICTLTEYVNQNSKYPMRGDQLAIAQDVVRGVSILHKVGITVGDLKPDNVLLFSAADGSMVAKIGDFGFSRGGADLGTSSASDREISGRTDAWCAPELLEQVSVERTTTEEDSNWSFRCQDAYSLGLILAFLLLGVREITVSEWKQLRTTGEIKSVVEGLTPSLPSDFIASLTFPSTSEQDTFWRTFCESSLQTLRSKNRHYKDWLERHIDTGPGQLSATIESDQPPGVIWLARLLGGLLNLKPDERIPIVVFQAIFAPDPETDTLSMLDDYFASSGRPRHGVSGVSSKSNELGLPFREVQDEIPPDVRRVIFLRLLHEAKLSEPCSEQRKAIMIAYARGWGCEKSGTLAKSWNDTTAMAEIPTDTYEHYMHVMDARHQTVWATMMRRFVPPHGLSEDGFYEWVIDDIAHDGHLNLPYPMNMARIREFRNIWGKGDLGGREMREYALAFWVRMELAMASFVKTRASVYVFNLDLVDDADDPRVEAQTYLAPHRHIVFEDDADRLLKEFPPTLLKGDTPEAELARMQAEILFGISWRRLRAKCFESLMTRYDQQLEAESATASSTLQTSLREGNTDAADFLLNYTSSIADLTSPALWIDLAETSLGYVIRHVRFRLMVQTRSKDFFPDPANRLGAHSSASLGSFTQQSPLICRAIEFQNWSGFLALLDSQIGVNIVRVQDGMLPIHLAAVYHQPMYIAALRAAGSVVNAHDYHHNTALHYAVQNTAHLRVASQPETDIVGALREYGIDEKFIDPDSEFMRSCTLALLTSLSGIDLNPRNDNGLTPLALCVSKGDIASVKHLLAKGADTSIPTFNAQSILQMAVISRNLDMVKLIYTHCADQLDSPSVSRMTPILQTAYMGERAICQFLLERHPDIRVKDTFHRNVFHAFSEFAHADVLQLLISSAGDTTTSPPITEDDIRELVNAYDSTGFTPLLSALSHPSFDKNDTMLPIVALLVPYIDNVDARSGPAATGPTALHLATARGLPDAVQVLLEFGADINATFGQGWTVFDCAYASPCPDDVVDVLCDAGAVQPVGVDFEGGSRDQVAEGFSEDWFEKYCRRSYTADNGDLGRRLAAASFIGRVTAATVFPEYGYDRPLPASLAAAINKMNIEGEIGQEVEHMKEIGLRGTYELWSPS